MSNSALALENTGVLTGWPKDVLRRATENVQGLIRDRRIGMFYIGRGVDLSRRKAAHGADDIVAVYETDSVENAMQVEEALNATFYGHPKNDNACGDARGGVSHEYANSVYVAVWWR